VGNSIKPSQLKKLFLLQVLSNGRERLGEVMTKEISYY
jgi:hypothetical protein